MAEDDREEASSAHPSRAPKEEKQAAQDLEAHVDMQFKQQQFDQIVEHRRQTSRLREQHRQQFDLIFSREVDPKEDRLRREIKTLHDREKQALKEFECKAQEPRRPRSCDLRADPSASSSRRYHSAG
jgi:exonuclease VII large subunit